MDLCPKGKISSIILEDNKISDFKIVPLSIQELENLLQKNKIYMIVRPSIERLNPKVQIREEKNKKGHKL